MLHCNGFFYWKGLKILSLTDICFDQTKIFENFKQKIYPIRILLSSIETWNVDNLSLSFNDIFVTRKNLEENDHLDLLLSTTIGILELSVTGCFKWPSPWAYIEPRKLLETLGAIYTKPLVGRVWKVLEMSREVHTSLHYGRRHERSPRLSREF